MVSENIKGSPNPSHLFFEINVGKGRIREWISIDSKSIEDEVIEIQSRPMSDPPLSDIQR